MTRRLLLLPLVVLAACSDGIAAADGEAAVARFHTALNAGDTRAIDALLSTEARRLRATLGTARAFRAIAARHGRYLSGGAGPATAETVQGRPFLRLAWNARYERGPVREDFTFTREGGQVRLHGYTVVPGG